jgi:kinesin family protein 13
MTFKGLVYLFDNPTNLAIIGENHQCGELKVNLIPTDENGEKNLS